MIAIEKNLLRIGLILAVFYQLIQTFASIVENASIVLISLNLALTVLYFFLLYLMAFYTQIIAMVYHFIVVVTFAFFWMNTSGIDETVPDLMCLYVAFIVVVSHSWYRIAALVLLNALIAILLYKPDYLQFLHQFDANTSVIQINIEFALIAVFISVFVSYMKQGYSQYHHKSTRRFSQQQNVENILVEQNEDLKLHQEEIRVINENLEAIVKERIHEVERKHGELSEYAFINAHMLRGPLSRVIGLTNLMEREPENYTPEQVQSIKALAIEMDMLVRKINDVLI